MSNFFYNMAKTRLFSSMNSLRFQTIFDLILQTDFRGSQQLPIVMTTAYEKSCVFGHSMRLSLSVTLSVSMSPLVCPSLYLPIHLSPVVSCMDFCPMPCSSASLHSVMACCRHGCLSNATVIRG